MAKTLIVILGPTGIGKTDLSLDLAQRLQTAIISSDSRQIYRELKIGTAVPTQEQLQAVPHFFVGNKSIFDYYNASMFEMEVLKRLEKLFSEHETVIMAGGSGMYIDAVCKGIDELPTIEPGLRQNLLDKWKNEGIESLRFDLKHLDPEYYRQVDLKNPKRLLKALEVCLMTGKPYSSFLTRQEKKRDFDILSIGLYCERSVLYERINHRVDKMLQAGLEAEARQFLPHKHLNALNTVGYKELFPYFEGKYSRQRAIELIKRNTRRYAKRQLSWFKRDKTIHWFEVSQKQKIINFVLEKT